MINLDFIWRRSSFCGAIVPVNCRKIGEQKAKHFLCAILTARKLIHLFVIERIKFAFDIFVPRTLQLDVFSRAENAKTKRWKIICHNFRRRWALFGILNRNKTHRRRRNEPPQREREGDWERKNSMCPAGQFECSTFWRERNRERAKKIVGSCCSCCFRFNFNRDSYVQFSRISTCKLSAHDFDGKQRNQREKKTKQIVCSLLHSLFVDILLDSFYPVFWPNTKREEEGKKITRRRPENIYKNVAHEAAGEIYDKTRTLQWVDVDQLESTKKYTLLRYVCVCVSIKIHWRRAREDEDASRAHVKMNSILSLSAHIPIDSTARQ